ncbi:hypothetical protein N0V95_007756 [Ascochyta clinopodiicola]|nr:hypothetical protein N0V95_007756 [Ascochyta clinopodiicola]
MVSIGFIALYMRNQGISAINGGFLQLLMTTTGRTSLDATLAKGLGTMGGYENVSDELRKTEVRFGELIDADDAKKLLSSESRSARDDWHTDDSNFAQDGAGSEDLGVEIASGAKLPDREGTVRGVQPESQKKVSTGQNCFRFLVPTEKAMRSPLAKGLINRVGLQSLNAFVAEDRRIILYPCRSGKLLNVAAMYTGGDEEVEESSWLNSGSKSDLLEKFKGFSPELQELCNLAEDVKLWSLASRDPPTVFHRGRLCLIGDAAHPTLPRK